MTGLVIVLVAAAVAVFTHWINHKERS